METYLSGNVDYWSQTYNAPNVESFVFRVYGRILKPQLGLDGAKHPKMLDFGCGEGAATGYFHRQGFDAYGVDISDVSIKQAQQHFENNANNFQVIDATPNADDCYFGGEFDLITSLQVLYYLDDDALEVRLQSLYNQLKSGGVVYFSMMGKQNWFYDHSTDAGNGMRKVTINTERVKLDNYFVNFIETKEELIKKFSLFEKVHVGYYDQVFREDEGSDHHWIFIGRKK